MITDSQKDFIIALYEQIGQENETDLDELSKIEAAGLISELMEIKREVQ